MAQQITVTNDMDITVAGHNFRIYRDALWINGGENDDMRVRSIEALEDADEVEIEITAADIARAEFFEVNS